MMRQMELDDLIEKIAIYMEYELWIRAMVDECLVVTEDEYMQLLMQNQNRLDDCKEGIHGVIDLLYPVEMVNGNADGETEEDFPGRIKDDFN